MKIISTKHAPAAVGPYSQAIIENGIVYVSGQIPFHPETMKAPETIEEQTKQSLENIKAILKEAGTSLEKVIKVNVFVKDINDFEKINKVYATYFASHKPARALVEVSRLPKDVNIEIECVAKV